MTRGQWIAVAVPPVLVATMAGVYRTATLWLGAEWAWYAGFLVYWPLWCIALPIRLLGWPRLKGLQRPRRMPALAWLVVAAPPLVALAGRIAGADGAERAALWCAVALVNGVCEEVLWRGVYIGLFPGRLRLGLLWPAVWFGAWHLAPGAVVLGSGAWALAGAAALLGLAYGWVAQRSGTIRWTAVSHCLAGLAQV
jgi:hypothetical protein